MNSCEIVTTITAIACALSESCSEEELELISAALTQLADTLSTILVVKNKDT